MKKIYLALCLAGCATAWTGCTKKNDAKPDDSGFFVKLFGGAKDERPNQIIALPTGGYAGVGYTESYAKEGRSDVFFFRIDRNGNVTKQIGLEGSEGRSIQLTPDGKLIMFGDVQAPNIPSSAYIVKTDFEGNIIWKKNYRPAEIDASTNVRGLSIENDKAGGYWILGSIEESSTESKLFITKIDETGNTVRERTYGSENSLNTISTIAQTGQGDVAIAGTTRNINSPTTNPTDIRLTLTNNLGNLKWDLSFNKNPTDVGVDLRIVPNGFILLGTTTLNNDNDIILYRLNEVGEAIVTATIGGEGNQYAKSVSPTQDGGYIVLGDTEKTGGTGTPQKDLLVTKLDYAGKVEWTKTFGSTEDDAGNLVRQDADGNYIILATIGFVTTKMCGVIRLNSKGEFLN